ncbi:MAG: radical SAM protein [Acidobacteria bacterium]|nr:radical SAM protein [Acidobacteriota bacterium]
MPDSPDLTESLCPQCLRRIPARRITENGSVYLEKSCPAHGYLGKALLWNNAPRSYSEWERPLDKNVPRNREKEPSPPPGYPLRCGLRPDHKQRTCTAVIEATETCNLRCPVCFASSPGAPAKDPKKEEIARMLRSLLDAGGPCTVQFSGGEPTLRDDLPELVALSRKMGFDHLQINTNGIRLAEDADFGRALADAGASVAFLQFDGVDDSVYKRIRGAGLFETKQRTIERCAELKLGVILVPTLLKGVNDDHIGRIIRFARKWVPVVKGVHFQPMTYLGRYPGKPRNEARLLIPDILDAIEKQTLGELKVENFIPPGCEESHCSFSALAVLGKDGRLIPTTHFDSVRRSRPCCSEDYARRSIDHVRSRWRYMEPGPMPILPGNRAGSGPAPEDDLFERIRSHSLSISGMAFQDAWNIDLERLERCCVHVVTPEGKRVPFCAYYMTGTRGRRLYPARKEY